jgi:hypothetical protein
MGLTKSTIPSKYNCHICHPRRLDEGFAKKHQKKRKFEIKKLLGKKELKTLPLTSGYGSQIKQLQGTSNSRKLSKAERKFDTPPSADTRSRKRTYKKRKPIQSINAKCSKKLKSNREIIVTTQEKLAAQNENNEESVNDAISNSSTCAFSEVAKK